MKLSNVLITGATGFLGSKVTEALCEQPDIKKIIASGRTIKKDKHVVHPKVEYQLGDLSDSFFAKSLFREIDVIINCASLCALWGKYEEFYQSNVVSQQNLVSSAKENGIKRFIYISSPSIYVTGKDRTDIKESDPIPGKQLNHYATTKLEAEKLLQKSNIPYIILRPRAIIGAGDTTIMPRVIASQRKNKLRIIGDGKNLGDVTSLKNVIHAIILAMNAPSAAWGEAYNITNDNRDKMWDIISYTFEKMGLSPLNKHISYNKAYFIALTIEVFAKLIRQKKEPTFHTFMVVSMANSFTLNIEKAKEKLGYTPLQTTLQSIDEFIEWYLDRQNN